MGYKEIIGKYRKIDLKEMRPSGFLRNLKKIHKQHSDNIIKNASLKDVDTCPLCGFADSSELFEDVCIKKCANCGLCYSGRIPVRVPDLYANEDYSRDAKELYYSNVDYRKRRFAEERVELISSQFTKETKSLSLIDIGCGTGWFLDIAAERFGYVSGQEICTHLAEWTAERLGIEVFTDDLSDMNPEKKFDIVTMFDLIEHLEDPLKAVLNCKNFLEKNGVLVIYTPNYDSIGFEVMGKDCNLIIPFEHLVCFNESSIKFLAEKAGMHLQCLKTAGMDVADIASFYEWQGKEDASKQLSSMFNSLQPVIDEAGCANHIRCILAKKD